MLIDEGFEGAACTVGVGASRPVPVGGCVSACAAGFVDADGLAADGCECKLTNGGVEICDGLDNDCNGAVDDGVGAVNYPGPAGTMGVGVCTAGAQVCQGGQLTQTLPPRLPSAEVCDGLDNDCNGKVDDGFDLLADDENCGACGLTCAAGTHCQQGKCPTLAVPDGGVAPGDAGTPRRRSRSATTPRARPSASTSFVRSRELRPVSRRARRRPRSTPA